MNQPEPFGMENPEPVFAARGARVAFPPKILKEKHVKMRLTNGAPRVPRPSPGLARAGVFGIDALGWRMAEQVQKASILAGDIVDVAFTLEVNDHPEFGGLELRLEDVLKSTQAQSASALLR